MGSDLEDFDDFESLNKELWEEVSDLVLEAVSEMEVKLEVEPELVDLQEGAELAVDLLKELDEPDQKQISHHHLLNPNLKPMILSTLQFIVKEIKWLSIYCLIVKICSKW